MIILKCYTYMYKNLNLSDLFTPVVVCTCTTEIPILGGKN